MRTPVKLGIYAVALVIAFGAALGAGRVVGPSDEPGSAGAAAQETAGGHADSGGHGDSGGHADSEAGSGGHAEGGGDPGPNAPAHPPGGLQVSEGGYRLVPDTTGLTVGTATDFRFRILGPDGAPVTRYTVTHERDLHMIVVRRDLAGFQHLHPTLGTDGRWSIPLTVAEAGQYRVFADFQPAGRAEALTLGVDVPAAGTYQPRPPAPEHSHRTEVDGYRVEVNGHLKPGTASTLTMRVTRGGKPVTDLQPYLGALGHLVALRDGDLAYLHVHPNSGSALSFTVEVPSAGTYGLFLDFKHGDAVRTAAFTAATE
jgi:hypothetical protein